MRVRGKTMSAATQIISRRLAPALALLFVVACSPASASTASRDNSDGVPTLTATEISDAVLFNTGPAAAYLVDLHRGDTRMSDDARATQETLNAGIARDPGWAHSFATRMQSRDPVLVDEAMRELAVRARAVIVARHGSERVDEVIVWFDGDALQERLIRATALDVGVETWMDKNLSGDIHHMVDIAETLFLVWVIDEPSGKGVIIRELMVATVTEELAVGTRV